LQGEKSRRGVKMTDFAGFSLAIGSGKAFSVFARTRMVSRPFRRAHFGGLPKCPVSGSMPLAAQGGAKP
jgi:hypothetical protein